MHVDEPYQMPFMTLEFLLYIYSYGSVSHWKVLDGCPLLTFDIPGPSEGQHWLRERSRMGVETYTDFCFQREANLKGIIDAVPGP